MSKYSQVISGGRVTIPKKMRDDIGLKDGDMTRVRVDNGQIIIEKIPDGQSHTRPKVQVVFQEVV